jgi:hypothetical protein
MKASIIKKGNIATFKMDSKIVKKTMNKKDRHSHLLPVKLWVFPFSHYFGHRAQGMLIKPRINPGLSLTLQRKETCIKWFETRSQPQNSKSTSPLV